MPKTGVYVNFLIDKQWLDSLCFRASGLSNKRGFAKYFFDKILQQGIKKCSRQRSIFQVRE